MGWMYWRYFFWNFVGRQNAYQGYMPWNLKNGHWMSGVKFIDEMRLYNMDEMTDTMKNHKGANKYYFLPLLFGLIGLFFHFKSSRKEFYMVMMLFLITGLGIIMYSNQPPNEPRERDYVLAGSFFTFCIWIGLGVLGMAKLYMNRVAKDNNGGGMAPVLIGSLALVVPALMGFQNFDDHSRMGHYGSRDYAANFLNSVDENAIIFTYGDNDTYPLWYAQEVENIRRDVRVVNLSLIAVDWYIEKLRRAVNDSPPIKLTVPSEAYRGNKRNQVFFYNPQDKDLNTPIDAFTELAFIGSQNQPQTIMRSKNLVIPVDANRMIQNGVFSPQDAGSLTQGIPIKFPESSTYILKDQLAVLDLIVSNLHERPIYFAVTCKNDKLMGLNDYMQMEGLGLKIIPVRTSSIRELAIYGSGRVNTDKTYDNIMNKWKWGNFDTHETFIDESYAAEIQAMRIIMMRTSQDLLIKGQSEKAANMAEQYFSAFPHMNFPYDDGVMPFIAVLSEAGRKETARKHMDILAEETIQRLRFYDSLADDEFESFRQDYGYALRSVSEMLREVDKLGDTEFSARIKDKIGGYDITKMKR